MIASFLNLLTLVYFVGIASSTYAILLILDTLRSPFIHAIRQSVIYFSKDSKAVMELIILNCKRIFKRRICGKTACNPFIYPLCKWSRLHSNLPLYKHTLILDLDETLVYSCRFSDNTEDMPSLDCIGITIVVLSFNKYASFYVYKRPFLDFFLDTVFDWFDVVAFTAGEKTYADAVLNVIDPLGRIKRRLYKQDCAFVNGSLVKRIETVNKRSDTIIVDNNPECYCFDKSNAIPISSWYGNAKDKELRNMLPLLDLLRSVDDVRTVLCLNK